MRGSPLKADDTSKIYGNAYSALGAKAIFKIYLLAESCYAKKR
jgi:hypothetical protein